MELSSDLAGDEDPSDSDRLLLLRMPLVDLDDTYGIVRGLRFRG